jgi:N6-adenosine-specific RNA methylase IME4
MTFYKTLLADPPWSENMGGNRGANQHYPLMSTREIIEYLKQIPISENAHIYLWTTNNALKSAIAVLEEIGFRYVTNLVWVKPSIGVGQYFRGQHELCLFGVKGSPGFKSYASGNWIGRTDESTVLFADKNGHSRKPDHLYVAIEKVSFPPYVEVFARRRREGWSVFGDQAPIEYQKLLIPNDAVSVSSSAIKEDKTDG